MTDSPDMRMTPTEIIEVQHNDSIAHSPYVDMMAQVEQRAAAYKQVIKACLSVTSPLDWTNQGGKPFPDSNAAKKIARLFGLTIKIGSVDKFWTEDEKGRFYTYRVEGWCGKNEVESILETGSCTSRDKFFGVQNEEPKPLSEVNEEHIRKKAIANFYGRAIKSFVGLGGITWEQLSEANPALSKEGTASVDFNNRKSQGSPDAKPEGSELTYNEMRSAIGNMLLELFNGDKAAASARLQELTSFTNKSTGQVVPGKTSAKALSDNQTKYKYAEIQKLFKTQFGSDYVLPAKAATAPTAGAAEQQMLPTEGGVNYDQY